MCFAITIVEEGISFRPFSPPSPSTKTQNINLGFSNDHVGQAMYKQLFGKAIGEKTRIPMLTAATYTVLAKNFLLPICCSSCFSGLSILFPETLLYSVKNSPRLDLSNLPPF